MLVAKRVNTRTASKYKRSRTRWLQFCEDTSRDPLQADQTTLCQFIAYCFQFSQINHNTLNVELAAVRDLHIVHNTFQDRRDMSRLAATRMGFTRLRHKTRTSKAVTIPILKRMLALLSSSDRDEIMTATALKMAFWSMMRINQFCADSTTKQGPHTLSWDDLTIEWRGRAWSAITVIVPSSKTNQF